MFEEDLFAPADEPEAYTDDVPLFLELQRKALEARVLNPPKGVTYKIVHDWRPPPGAIRELEADPMQPKRGRTVMWHLDDETGQVSGEVYQFPSAPKKEAREGEDAEAPEPLEGRTEEVSAEFPDTPVAPAEPAEKAAPAGITKAGLSLLAAAKTAALRERIDGGLDANTALACLLLLFTAPNVGLSIPDFDFEEKEALFRQIGALVAADGTVYTGDQGRLLQAAQALLAAMLACAEPAAERRSYRRDAGEVAEWIGHSLDAENFLPRFDTPEFLATCSAKLLTEVAAGTGLKPAKTAKGLREQLANNAPGWRPDAALFHAPAPSKGDEEEEDGDDPAHP